MLLEGLLAGLLEGLPEGLLEMRLALQSLPTSNKAINRMVLSRALSLLKERKELEIGIS
jgi:hypothetical protein